MATRHTDVVFVLKCTFSVRTLGEFPEPFSFDFLLPPDAYLFKRRSVQGIARL
jgi:hypothetical protein